MCSLAAGVLALRLLPRILSFALRLTRVPAADLRAPRALFFLYIYLFLSLFVIMFSTVSQTRCVCVCVCVCVCRTTTCAATAALRGAPPARTATPLRPTTCRPSSSDQGTGSLDGKGRTRSAQEGGHRGLCWLGFGALVDFITFPPPCIPMGDSK